MHMVTNGVWPASLYLGQAGNPPNSGKPMPCHACEATDALVPPSPDAEPNDPILWTHGRIWSGQAELSIEILPASRFGVSYVEVKYVAFSSAKAR